MTPITGLSGASLITSKKKFAFHTKTVQSGTHSNVSDSLVRNRHGEPANVTKNPLRLGSRRHGLRLKRGSQKQGHIWLFRRIRRDRQTTSSHHLGQERCDADHHISWRMEASNTSRHDHMELKSEENGKLGMGEAW